MPQTSPKKILVVDDEEEIVAHLTNVLKRANYEVISTTKGKEVLELAENFQPDLIILDIVMVDMDGSEVASMLSENPPTAKIPIIFLTGAIITKDEEIPGMKSGKHYVLVKPITPQELLDVVKKVLAA